MYVYMYVYMRAAVTDSHGYPLAWLVSSAISHFRAGQHNNIKLFGKCTICREIIAYQKVITAIFESGNISVPAIHSVRIHSAPSSVNVCPLLILLN